MFFVYALLVLPGLVASEKTLPKKVQLYANLRVEPPADAQDWPKDGLPNVVDILATTSKPCGEVEGRHRRHRFNKYVLPLIVGWLLIKSILLPIALKALAVLSGKAIVLSLMSLILAAIVGLKKSHHGHHSYDVVNLSGKYRRKDAYDLTGEADDAEPYRYYRDKRKKRESR